MLFAVLAEQVFKRTESAFMFLMPPVRVLGLLNATANVRTRTNEIYTRVVQVENTVSKTGIS